MPKLDIKPGDLIKEISAESMALVYEAGKPFVFGNHDKQFKNCLVLEYLYKENSWIKYETGVYVHFLSVLYNRSKLDIVLNPNPKLKVIKS